MKEATVTNLLTEILEKLNYLCAKVDKLERKIDSVNKISQPKVSTNAIEKLKTHDIKSEVEQMLAKHRSKLSKIYLGNKNDKR